MLKIRRILTALVLGLTATALLTVTPAAQAKHSQLAMFEEDPHLQQNPEGTMAMLRQLGVGIVRVDIEWSAVAPNPYSFRKPNFDGANDTAYPPGTWTRFDRIVQAGLTNHIKLDFLLTGGAPFWATGPGIPAGAKNRHFAWRPSAKLYGDFVHAVGLRYRKYVHYWELYNEPNFGEDLGPQAVRGVLVAPAAYRSLLDAGYESLSSVGAASGTIVIGQLAARGNRDPGVFGQTKPLQFIRTLYCVDGSYRRLRGRSAAAVGCPTSTASSQRFSSQHPALFKASGFGIHPYPQGLPPTQDSSSDPDFGTFPKLPLLERTLDSTQRAYGSHNRLDIYNNEYGYVTRPPAHNPLFVSPNTAAFYLNWSEYLSWSDPRIATSMQYLLFDPNEKGPSQFFSGLRSSTGKVKSTLAAYRMPLFLPASVARNRQSLVVWGAVRPAYAYGGRQLAQIQFRRGSRGRFVTLATIAITDPQGYFQTRIVFPASGAVQVAWSYPGGPTVTSRITPVTIR